MKPKDKRELVARRFAAFIRQTKHYHHQWEFRLPAVPNLRRPKSTTPSSLPLYF